MSARAAVGDAQSLRSDLPEPLGSQKAGRYTFITLDECRSAKVRQLLDYWQQIRSDRLMPQRQDIDPTMIWPLLRNISLSEWHRDPERLFYRISGTEVVASIGIELGGKWLTEVYPEAEDVARTMKLYSRVVDARTPVIGRTDGTRMRLGIDSYEWAICPLSDDGTLVTHFIVLEDYVAPRPYLGAPS